MIALASRAVSRVVVNPARRKGANPEAQGTNKTTAKEIDLTNAIILYDLSYGRCFSKAPQQWFEDKASSHGRLAYDILQPNIYNTKQ